MKLFRFAAVIALFAVIALSGCATAGGPDNPNTARKAMTDAIALEPKGAYFVGRRYYKSDYKFWGFVRQSGEPWTTAKMVMLNENSKSAPDRAQGKLGSDNNYEYKLMGSFSGDTVYEPASNAFYPEFVLKDYELRSSTPGSIYRERGATNPEYRIIARPF